ncbi:MAG: PQQ-binding-like beta-propeller repeat protein [Verrucomicrobiota bacterium]
MHPPLFTPLTTGSVKKGHRLWMPLSVLFLAAAAIGVIGNLPEFERNLKGWSIAAIVLLAAVIVLLWFAFLSRIRGRTRLLGLGGLAFLALVMAFTTRIDGTTSGIGFPRLTWKWAPHRGAPPSTAPLPIRSEPPLPRTDLVDVPQFFGPNRDGLVRGARLARDWNANPPRELWRQSIGSGWSAFSVVAGRAYTQEQRGEEETVTCYDLLSGRLLWLHGNPVHFTQWQGGDGPRATPTVDHGRVYAMGATGILDCLDAVTGQRIWSRDVLKENNLENLEWGMSGSPLVFDESVVVTGGNTNGASLLAYQRATGEPLWHSGRDKASYASPLLATLAGKRLILSPNAGSLTAHDPGTGEIVFDHPWPDEKRPKAAQPVLVGSDRVFLSAGYGVGCVLLEIKAGADGKLSGTPLWKNLRMKTQFNSAAARDGFFYGLDDGLLACVEIGTGERKWKEGRYGSGQTLLVDDLILIQSEPGAVILAEAKPEGGRELGRLPALSSKTWNHPTLAGRYLLVRNDREAVCYELPVEAAGSE